jgi:ComF family protein
VDKFLKTKEFFLDLAFPKFCLGCNREGAYLCDDCRGLLDIAQFNYCLCEQNPTIIPLHEKKGKCNRCQDKRLAGLYFALPYKDPSTSSGRENSLVKKLIWKFKYAPYLKDLAETLASLIIEHLIISKKNTEDIYESSILVPVPSDKKKIRERGYNQSEELAKELSKVLRVPVVANILIKTKITKPQMESNKQERETNLINAFEIKKSENGSQIIMGKKVFLVDDVYTTGSTMAECAKVLRKAGAKSVWGIVIAREG